MLLVYVLSGVTWWITALTVFGQDVTVNTGGSVVLFCELFKNEDLTRITWQRRTKAITANTNFFVVTPDGKTKDELNGRVEFVGDVLRRDGAIRLKNVTFLDEGVYTCIFSFFPSGPSSKLVNVEVRVPPAVTVRPDKIPVAGATEEIIAACTASGAKPAAEVSWSLGDLSQTLRVQTNVSVNADGTSTTSSYLMGVASKDLNHQKVVCSVEHPALREGFEQAYTINVHCKSITNRDAIVDVEQCLTVRDPPHVVYVLSVGDRTTTQEFICEADANPKPSEFIWSRNVSFDETLSSSRSLIINRTAESDGLYYCKASNQYDSQVGSLLVQRLPCSYMQGNNPGWIAFAVLLVLLSLVLCSWFAHKKWPKDSSFRVVRSTSPMGIFDGTPPPTRVRSSSF